MFFFSRGLKHLHGAAVSLTIVSIKQSLIKDMSVDFSAFWAMKMQISVVFFIRHILHSKSSSTRSLCFDLYMHIRTLLINEAQRNMKQRLTHFSSKSG